MVCNVGPVCCVSQVEVSIPTSVLSDAASQADAVLTINAPGQAAITVPLQRSDVGQADMR